MSIAGGAATGAGMVYLRNTPAGCHVPFFPLLPAWKNENSGQNPYTETGVLFLPAALLAP